jgi:hypothetical protein
MDSFIASTLVLLLIAIFVAGCLGFVLGSLWGSKPRAESVRFPRREFEHECDAHYPRFGD